MEPRLIAALLSLDVTVACSDNLDYTPLDFSVSGDRFIAVGEIDEDTQDRFEDALEDNPQIRVLELRNISGSVDDDANVEFGRVVREMGFTTVVPSNGLIASGGTDLFLAGKKRMIEPGACIGVHSWSAGDLTATDVSRDSAEHDRYLDYYKSIDIDETFYWFTIQAASAEDMHWVTAAEVDRYKLATSPAGALSSSNICDSR